MNNKFKEATAHIRCGNKFGTAFLIGPSHAITAYHVVKRFVKGDSIDLEFPFMGKAGDRSAKLLNAREAFNKGIDLAILELDNPLEEIEPLKLFAEELTRGQQWDAYGFPSTKDTPGEIFTGTVSMLVEQHRSLYDLALNCKEPNITDEKYNVFGASGSALVVDEKVVALLSDKLPGGTLGAVSIKSARDLLNEYNITFKDNIPWRTASPKSELAKMLEMYPIKIQDYLKNNMTLPFESKLDNEDNDLINSSYFNDFFEMSTWRSEIIKQISMISKESYSNSFTKERVEELHDVCELDLSYEEFEDTMRGKNDWILREIPDNKTYKDIRPLLFQLYSLLNKRYNKVLILTGESGSGKTHLLRTILSSSKIEKGLDYCSIRIPVNSNDIKKKGFEEAIKSSLNHFLNTNFNNVSDINKFIIKLESQGFNFTVIFIIDDLQTLCNSSAKNYIDLKQTIMTYTKYDWISWCIAINEFDQYLIMDNSNFLNDYCYLNDSEKDANLFVSMSRINNENKVCYKILNKHGIDTKAIEQFPKNISNIEMLLSNPLISYVYAHTVSENEKELLNIGYFNFIKRYSDIKKTQMLECSERDLSFQEKEVQIDNEINQVVNTLIKNKKLSYPISEFNDLFKDLESCFSELLSVHLVNKTIEEYEDPFEKRKDIKFEFVFKLYWAYKILLQFRSKNNWLEFSSWRKSFINLKDDLLGYEILYLDTDFENNQEVLNQEIVDVLKSDNEKASLLFFGAKTSFNCQGVIFLKLLEEEELILNKQETFALMYFLMHTDARNASNPQKCMVLSKYLNKVSEYELDGYLKDVCKSIFGKLSRPARLKDCISEFIGCTDTRISRMIGKLAAENFVRIIINKQYKLEEFIKDNLIKFLCKNLEGIEKRMKNRQVKGKNSDVPFIEYFLRYLFTSLIEYNNDNKFLLHEILLTNKFYYFGQVDNKLKPIGDILRSNSAIAYGSYYKHLHHSKKKNFKEQYISFISKLLESKLTEHRIFAFHFISNTLINEDVNSTLDIDFIPLLKIIHEDKQIRWFNDEREAFYERNYYPYI
ncbi:trypsin-like peptidase domain-containing protein [Priestia megaterium]|uniref:trypsin-like peptidase domain-containing protein n=1 Tax=Priestia megaterium TaxID=1404 RepID=UPI003F7F84D2